MKTTFFSLLALLALVPAVQAKTEITDFDEKGQYISSVVNGVTQVIQGHHYTCRPIGVSVFDRSVESIAVDFNLQEGKGLDHYSVYTSHPTSSTFQVSVVRDYRNYGISPVMRLSAKYDSSRRQILSFSIIQIDGGNFSAGSICTVNNY